MFGRPVNPSKHGSDRGRSGHAFGRTRAGVRQDALLAAAVVGVAADQVGGIMARWEKPEGNCD